MDPECCWLWWLCWSRPWGGSGCTWIQRLQELQEGEAARCSYGELQPCSFRPLLLLLPVLLPLLLHLAHPHAIPRHLLLCYTQRRRDNFPGTQFFLDKFLFSKKGLGQGIPKQLVELKKVSEFFDGSLSPSENRPLGEKTLSSQMLLELNFFLMVSYI